MCSASYHAIFICHLENDGLKCLLGNGYARLGGSASVCSKNRLSHGLLAGLHRGASFF